MNEAKFFIRCWVNTQTGEIEFDYFWCYDTDIEKKEIIDEIGGMEHVDNIYYQVFNRPNIIR